MPADMGLEMPEELDPAEAEPDADGDDFMAGPTDDAELDPVFAADAGEAFPDLDDAGLTALQRAILGLMGRGP